ncbi:Crp/Fnr family transcriptional regulator [Erwinia sp. 9145]|uniref:Crp/Fnr family transcriptional regulator n=1 Tax=Erwinia sp. 9145 TaxID=1500895 RepID=UPI0006919B99|nr:Crp/Fnr family transcriptional regulator [Erwinia sp. 9145]
MRKRNKSSEETSGPALFAGLTGSPHALLTRLEALPKQTRIYPQEDEASSFYYLHSGLVGLYHMLENGKVCLIRLFCPGEFFGYRSLFGDSYYHCSSRVQRTASVTRITPYDPDRFLNHYSALHAFMVRRLAGDLAEAEKRMASMAYDKSRQRVMRAISTLYERWPGYDFTWREIAEYAGCETETAIRHSRELKMQALLPENFTRLRE